MPNKGVLPHAPPAALPAHHAYACALAMATSATHISKLACKAPAGSWLMCRFKHTGVAAAKGQPQHRNNPHARARLRADLPGNHTQATAAPQHAHSKPGFFAPAGSWLGPPAFAQLAEAVHLAVARGTSVRAGPSSAGPRHGTPKHARSQLAHSKAPAGSWLDVPANTELGWARHAAAAMAPATYCRYGYVGKCQLFITATRRGPHTQSWLLTRAGSLPMTCGLAYGQLHRRHDDCTRRTFTLCIRGTCISASRE